MDVQYHEKLFETIKTVLSEELDTARQRTTRHARFVLIQSNIVVQIKIVNLYAGEGVVIPSEFRELEKLLKEETNFNLLSSERMSLDRSMKPDARYPNCQTIKYPNRLPTVSVILIYHNEPWVLLVRTIHGIINTAPTDLLEEIILVDDCSTTEALRAPLTKHLKLLPARIVRLQSLERLGLIRARLQGAKRAKVC